MLDTFGSKPPTLERDFGGVCNHHVIGVDWILDLDRTKQREYFLEGDPLFGGQMAVILPIPPLWEGTHPPRLQWMLERDIGSVCIDSIIQRNQQS